MTRNTGAHLTGEEREAGLAYARQWRIKNKPYFDALYGPETQTRTCLACNGRGKITEPK